jgi:hypothetical protein
MRISKRTVELGIEKLPPTKQGNLRRYKPDGFAFTRRGPQLLFRARLQLHVLGQYRGTRAHVRRSLMGSRRIGAGVAE